jgi:hypothetical protein
MKLIMMAAALMLGGAAVAQTTEEETDATTTESTSETTPAPDATTSIPPPATTTTTTTAAPGNMSTMRDSAPQTVAPGNTSPETDARGIKVISDAATAPAGYNQPAQTLAPGSAIPTVAPPTPTASGPLPPCTRTVTDRCTQTYERGRQRPAPGERN